MADYHQLWKTLFKIKDFLIEHNVEKFKSFDLVSNIYEINGNSFRVAVNSSEDVMYFLKFYNLSENITDKDIDKLYVDKGFIAFDKISLVLQV